MLNRRLQRVFVLQHGNEPSETIAALLGNETEFGEVRLQGIDELRALADQEIACAMNGEGRLLIRRFDGDGSVMRSGSRAIGNLWPSRL